MLSWTSISKFSVRNCTCGRLLSIVMCFALHHATKIWNNKSLNIECRTSMFLSTEQTLTPIFVRKGSFKGPRNCHYEFDITLSLQSK